MLLRTGETSEAIYNLKHLEYFSPGLVWSRLRRLAVLKSGFKRRYLIAVALACLVVFEMRTSWLQSHLLAAAAKRISYTVEPGPSPSVHYPQHGPYNERLGYTKLPGFLENLTARNFEVKAQARSSTLAASLMNRGLYPIYKEKTQAGLRVLDRDGRALFQSRYPERAYSEFGAIPPLIVKTLLFIENREILDGSHPYRNPAVEWDRLAGAVLDLSVNAVDRNHRVTGGSTLATQIEKIRHSPGGRTTSVVEKFRQMASATLRAYQGGKNTLEARRRIVRDYINSIPLSAIPGYGEVSGLGDGLWAWYGADFRAVNQLLFSNAEDKTSLTARARAYRQVLSLLLAVNSPSAYLLNDRKALDARTDSYLRLLCQEGLISTDLRDTALHLRPALRMEAPAEAPISFIERKGADPVRTRLLSLLGLDSLYDLDRVDLTVSTTLDRAAQDKVATELERFDDPSQAENAGLVGARLLQTGDPRSVIYSFTLYERGNGFSLLRIQADNYDQPLNINEGTKLELGSTAKLRTLVNYLEIVAGLHRRYAALPPDRLRSLQPGAHDPLTQWAIHYVLAAEDKGLRPMLEAAMDRRYSANPREAFFTGGGLHRFVNFDSKDNARVLTVREGFERSVNLVFIRLMRDIVTYYMYQLPGVSPSILKDDHDSRRLEYLARFADLEGSEFLERFYQKYRGETADEALEKLLRGARPTPKRLAVIYRSVRPEAGPDQFAAFIESHWHGGTVSGQVMADLYNRYGPDKFNLPDRGYLARVHPLELWLLEYTRRHPQAGLDEILAASKDQRQEVYGWLYKTRYKSARDTRIRIMLEIDAFKDIHRAWLRQGFPFRSLVPSYATAIGSSGDNPAALAELAGIILSGGVRYPSIRIRELHFAKGTPVETIVGRRAAADERVYPPELAAVVRNALFDVVENGTGRRAWHSVVLSDGTTVAVGGKTGTGDNRFEILGPRGQVIGERILNRTATFVFVIGDRFFGTVTASVPGKAAAGYKFTSALPVQTFKYLVPAFLPLLERSEVPPSGRTLKAEQNRKPVRPVYRMSGQPASTKLSSDAGSFFGRMRTTTR